MNQRGAHAGANSAPGPAQALQPDGHLAPIDTDGFTVTDTMRRWVAATYPDLDIEHSTQQFISHYRSTGARRKSWPDAWQKWIRDDAKRAGTRPAAGKPQGAANGWQPYRDPEDLTVYENGF